MPIVDASELQGLAFAVVEGLGSDAATARRVADHLVEADLSGHGSHGVMRLPQYVDDADQDLLKPDAQPEIIHDTSTTAVVDGHEGWGPVAARLCLDLAIEKARRHGMSAVSLRRAHHVGRIGPYAQAAAEQGFVGQIFCNVAGKDRVVPWGGRDGRMGTNPIAVAIPASGDPIVADLATTAVAEGKIRLAKIDGRPVPPGWVFDADGQFSTDPNDAYEAGGLAPLGGDQGHKGYCLSVVMDVLAGLLTDNGCGMTKGIYCNGLLIQVVDPGAFGYGERFIERVDAYIAYLKSSRPRDGVEEVLVPGEIERHRMKQRLRDGLEISDALYAELEKLRERFM
ncbi:MAG: dehydrogenase [Phycisphaeraceae bacterium]|nr:dehydrogenase [Phycisphaeraceae bacterium]